MLAGTPTNDLEGLPLRCAICYNKFETDQIIFKGYSVEEDGSIVSRLAHMYHFGPWTTTSAWMH